MQGSEQAFCFIAVALSLCACFVWVLYEIEEWRRRSHQRAELTREAVRFVVPRAKAGR